MVLYHWLDCNGEAQPTCSRYDPFALPSHPHSILIIICIEAHSQPLSLHKIAPKIQNGSQEFESSRWVADCPAH
jgi:hypothetical protein